MVIDLNENEENKDKHFNEKEEKVFENKLSK